MHITNQRNELINLEKARIYTVFIVKKDVILIQVEAYLQNTRTYTMVQFSSMLLITINHECCKRLYHRFLCAVVTW